MLSALTAAALLLRMGQTQTAALEINSNGLLLSVVLFLVNLFLIKLMRISGFSSLFSAIAVFSAHLPESAKNIAIAEKREENPEILTNLMRKRLTRLKGTPLYPP